MRPCSPTSPDQFTKGPQRFASASRATEQCAERLGAAQGPPERSEVAAVLSRRCSCRSSLLCSYRLRLGRGSASALSLGSCAAAPRRWRSLRCCSSLNRRGIDKDPPCQRHFGGMSGRARSCLCLGLAGGLKHHRTHPATHRKTVNAPGEGSQDAQRLCHFPTPFPVRAPTRPIAAAIRPVPRPQAPLATGRARRSSRAPYRASILPGLEAAVGSARAPKRTHATSPGETG